MRRRTIELTGLPRFLRQVRLDELLAGWRMRRKETEVAEKVVIGNAELWHGDCRELRPTLQPVDAVISDPPYGQKLKTNIAYASGTKKRMVPQRGGGSLEVSPQVWPDTIHGDDEPFDPAPWLALAPRVLLWGAHKFHDRLPDGGTWLVWDKVPTGKVRDQGDGEAAWLNVPGAMRIYRLLWDGLCVGDAARAEVTAGQQRVHPTQKPVALMEWCILQAKVAQDATILDPYMGAGSTGIAAVKMGRRFVGIEIERKYFDTACERIAAAQAQERLFA